jgi:hypothetical protein
MELRKDGRVLGESSPNVQVKVCMMEEIFVPRLTASSAYSTWKTCPSGLKTT